jgi:hypothetical protein
VCGKKGNFVSQKPQKEVKEFDVKYSIINVKRDGVCVLLGTKLPTKKLSSKMCQQICTAKCISFKCVMNPFVRGSIRTTDFFV